MHVNPKPRPPRIGGEHTFMTDTGRQAVPPGIPGVNLVPVGDGGPGLPPQMPSKKRRPLLPTPTELATLPRAARAAFAARCAARVAPLVRLGDVDDVVGGAALAILRTDSEPWALQFFRVDFNRVRRLAKANRWTDDTPIPPDVLGPLWPAKRTPKWARPA